MDPQTLIARRIARELRPGMLVNLGIGIPTLVSNYLPANVGIFVTAQLPQQRSHEPQSGNQSGGIGHEGLEHSPTLLARGG